MTLWLVEIDESDWDYDRFSDAAVWAETAEDAEARVRSAIRYPEEIHGRPDGTTWTSEETLWIEQSEWKLKVKPAPTEGVVLVHWHAG